MRYQPCLPFSLVAPRSPGKFESAAADRRFTLYLLVVVVAPASRLNRRKMFVPLITRCSFQTADEWNTYCRLSLLGFRLEDAGQLRCRRIKNLDELGRGRVQQPEQLAAQDLDARQVGQSHQILVLQPLAVQIAELDLRLVELG